MHDYPEQGLMRSEQPSQMLDYIREITMLTDDLTSRLRPVLRPEVNDSSAKQPVATEMESQLLSVIYKLQSLNTNLHI